MGVRVGVEVGVGVRGKVGVGVEDWVGVGVFDEMGVGVPEINPVGAGVKLIVEPVVLVAYGVFVGPDSKIFLSFLVEI
ncbi:MAG: hypothetical protein CEN90_142 [Parcubacteria group bacterium Licking1014_17]|nr:MAG: hypothetical protein CEN90_142 [Parcubacteria group bacterium Licking1014_17]